MRPLEVSLDRDHPAGLLKLCLAAREAPAQLRVLRRKGVSAGLRPRGRERASRAPWSRCLRQVESWGRVEVLAAQKSADVTWARETIYIAQDAQLALGGEPPPLRPLHEFRVRNDPRALSWQRGDGCRLRLSNDGPAWSLWLDATQGATTYFASAGWTLPEGDGLHTLCVERAAGRAPQARLGGTEKRGVVSSILTLATIFQAWSGAAVRRRSRLVVKAAARHPP